MINYIFLALFVLIIIKIMTLESKIEKLEEIKDEKSN